VVLIKLNKGQIYQSQNMCKLQFIIKQTSILHLFWYQNEVTWASPEYNIFNRQKQSRKSVHFWSGR